MFFEVETRLFSSVPLFLLLFARCVGVLWFAPVFREVVFSSIARLAFAFLLSLVTAPVALSVAPPSVAPESFCGGAAALFTMKLVVELFIGAAVGACLGIFFQGVALAGEVISRVGGVAVSGSFDPIQGGETTAPSTFLFWIATVVFIACGGLEAFVDGFLQFLTTLPPGSAVVVDNLVDKTVDALEASFALGLRLCAPVVLTTFVVYLGVGISGRLFSQLNLASVSFNVNALLTLALLFLCIGVFCQVFQSELSLFFDELFDGFE